MASKRGYLNQTDLAEYANITITDATEADDVISQAEELLDWYVGFQDKAIREIYEGRVAASSSTSITLEANRHQNVFEANYFLYCQVEIIGGTGSGQARIVTASTKPGVLTVATWTTTPSTDSYYKIYQLGRFPRTKDSYYDGQVATPIYSKSIPEAVRRATAAQVQYIIKMGDNFFAGDATTLQSESIGNYSYSRGQNAMGKESLIAPKAKMYLRGIINRKGTMSVSPSPGAAIEPINPT